MTARRGSIVEFTVGSAQARGLVVSTDDHNRKPGRRPWVLQVANTSGDHGTFAIALKTHDPGWPGTIAVPVVYRVDPTALRRDLGYLSHETYAQVERALRDYLELP